MSYQKQNFANGEVLTASQLNHMEDGIAKANENTNSGSGLSETSKTLLLSLLENAAYTRPGSYDVYATLPTDGGSEELPPSVYEQFVARVLESARAAAESARRAENGAADTAVQAALAQKAADKILADRTDADACAKRAEAAALRAESYAPADGRVLSVNGKGGAVRLTAQDVAAVPRPAGSCCWGMRATGVTTGCVSSSGASGRD